MADTCSGIYFWMTLPRRPPLLPLHPTTLFPSAPRRGAPGPPAVHERRWNPFFLSIEFNGYPRRLIYWMRSFAPARRRATTATRNGPTERVALDVVPIRLCPPTLLSPSEATRRAGYVRVTCAEIRLNRATAPVPVPLVARRTIDRRRLMADASGPLADFHGIFVPAIGFRPSRSRIAIVGCIESVWKVGLCRNVLSVPDLWGEVVFFGKWKIRRGNGVLGF